MSTEHDVLQSALRANFEASSVTLKRMLVGGAAFAAALAVGLAVYLGVMDFGGLVASLPLCAMTFVFLAIFILPVAVGVHYTILAGVKAVAASIAAGTDAVTSAMSRSSLTPGERAHAPLKPGFIAAIALAYVYKGLDNVTLFTKNGKQFALWVPPDVSRALTTAFAPGRDAPHPG